MCIQTNREYEQVPQTKYAEQPRELSFGRKGAVILSLHITSYKIMSSKRCFKATHLFEVNVNSLFYVVVRKRMSV